MASQALRAILQACKRLEDEYAKPALADEQEAARAMAGAQQALTAELGTALEAFKAETAALEPGEVDALVASLMAVRPRAAAAADFASLRIKLAETIQRMAAPAAPQSTYNARGGKQAKPPVAPARLDKSF